MSKFYVHDTIMGILVETFWDLENCQEYIKDMLELDYQENCYDLSRYEIRKEK